MVRFGGVVQCVVIICCHGVERSKAFQSESAEAFWSSGVGVPQCGCSARIPAYPSLSQQLDSFPKPRNIFRSACSAPRLWSLEHRLHTDFWGTRSTGWLLRSTLCRSGKSEIKCNQAGNCWWQMSASSRNSNYIDCRLRQASTTCARDLTTWQGVWQRCLDYRAMPRHLSWLNRNPDSYLNQARLISHVPTLIYRTRGSFTFIGLSKQNTNKMTKNIKEP